MNKSIRIGYFTNSYPRATDTFIQREVRGLRQRGMDLRTFAVRRPGAEHDVSPEVIEEKRKTQYLFPVGPVKLIGANLRIFLLGPRRYLSSLALALKTRRPGLRGLALQLAYFQEAVLLAQELKRQAISHVHNHLGDNSGTVTLLASKLMRVGYSITVHGPHIFFDPTHWALREKLRHSRFIACISHYCQSQMMLFSDQADWAKLKIIRCGVDIERFPYGEVRQRVARLLYAGRLAVEKGLPVLFESLRLLMDEGYDFELTLVGDGSDRQELESLAVRLGISGRLVFAGFAGQDAVLGHLRQSDIFVLPSFAEGVPVSLMEAMSCGIPVVATYVGGVAELVEPGLTGMLVPPSDSVALSKAIARYFEEFELRRVVSLAARQKVVESFNLDTEVSKLADLFLANAESKADLVDP
ncbi:MAG: glycosyltransferase [Steroidobacteraceae bacterium]